ncbi:glycoside hydrolase family 95 protein [Segetibacter sp. 3557_3]|uniref:glycoside hydrolase family 95 protein n=1 Tax=Segetibacter sp. 3557_3 TaxID=2547429 RepID=UPI001058D037|nr:glycoside hydrolase N-terminal domain-containing protein [Segetibacter sp. 3557_3]TDH28819.1 glycoside hydrolase family 95 protein [Segetibacter sp. 3557_3]
MNLKALLTTIILLTAVCTRAQELKLWYREPAVKWTEALPVGNGRLGAMIFGGTVEDRIQFNEETLWTGEPRDYTRAGAATYLDPIRKLLAAGKQNEAENLAEEKFMGRKSNEGDRTTWLNKMRSLEGMQGNPSLADYDDSKWKTLQVPTYEGWETVGMEIDGAVWFRTTFDLPADWSGKSLVLDLNRVRDQDFTYVNGKLVGTMNSTDPRKYTIPAANLVKGKNVIAIQVINYYDKGGIAGYKDTSRHIGIYPEGGAVANGISLNRPWKYHVQDDAPPAVPRYQADYQPFGDIYLRFPQQPSATQYRRELDLKNAMVRTTFTSNGITYTREYFASQPNQAIVVHLTASKPGSLSFETLLNSPHKNYSTRKIDDKTLGLSLQVRHGALKGESYLHIKNIKGTATITGDRIIVKNADEVTLYLTAGTNYKSFKDVSGDPAVACKYALKGLASKTYSQVKDAHIREYQQYFNTLSISLGSGNEQLPTNERIVQFAKTTDPSFVALYLQYGRYLLISASRPGTGPANLQGIWNDLLTPPWGSKYTTNINAEMNYWPAELLNLSPMHEPLFKMIDELAETGSKTAQVHYNAPGWVLHHNTDLWRGSAPINAANHGIWVTGGAWMCHHLWEHYRFTQDQQFLQTRAYPVMKQAAMFFNSFLVTDPKTGWLISTPSNSPEHGGLVAGPTMDHQIIRDLFKNVIAAADILKVDKAFRDTLAARYKRIAPNQVGKHGQLQEWLEDKDDPKDNHRHVSHLWGMYPGNEINWDESPELMKAAMQSLLQRGDAATGWSLAWKINFWSRFKDGDHAYKLIQMLISPAWTGGAGSYQNLFDAHPPFQIDGNFGGAAGIGEMLLQSHTKFIDLLPALPSALPTGEIKGIRARGGFLFEIGWSGGKLNRVSVLSTAGNTCTIRYGDRLLQLKTTKGKKYTLNGALEIL